MPLQAVTFDFHNTLAICDDWFELEVRGLVPAFLDWYERETGTAIEADVRERSQTVYRSMRLQIIEHGVEKDAVDGVLHVLDELGQHATRPLVAHGVEQLMRRTLPGSRPVPGVVDAVRQLAAAGMTLGVVSNAVYHPFLEWSLDKFSILDSFTAVVTSADAGFYKSRREIYDDTLQRLGITDAASAVHVGDSYRFDVEGARRAGMRTVWYRTNEHEGRGDAADLTVSTLEGIGALLLERLR